MVQLLTELAPDEGYNLSLLPDVRFLRSNRALSETPVLYEPGIVVVVQGRKRGFLGGQTYLYDARHYLAVSVPVPFTMETDATEKTPLLAIYFRLDFQLLAEVLVQMDDADLSAHPQTMFATRMDASMSASVLRFLEAMRVPMEARILGRSLVKEIYLRVLTGRQGASMRAALRTDGQVGKVAKAIRKIHAAYADKLDVEQLAHVAGMSPPSFHAHFKAVTATSPMQYLKSTRLHQARLLMLRNGLTVAEASARVGYESASQFSREFKRLFALPPTQEVARMKDAYALPDPEPSALFVSSH
ncbi:AraC family transcriptional regulator [Herbaspirillum huttiense]|uniref:AraC family transcriptional regulator n=1 Tax=Herbaspirillum huttiense subsp. lycopersici TaxID=3074428 RepID=A0ABU2ERM2_9BURK|nr:AraC family transcriptional regulator [Herbaspirillum huttiense]MDR9850473.1 AraC family transcriptional regulator [Herbaspirillum huttiense SE1]